MKKDIECNFKLIFDELIKINKIIYPDFCTSFVKKELSKLITKVKLSISLKLSDEKKLNLLLEFFYQENKFNCDNDSHFNSENMNLEYVFKERKGMPISLAAIFLCLAEKLKLDIYPVSFPTQFLLRVDLKDKSIFLDPWDGKLYNKQELLTLLKGYLGYGSILKPEYITKTKKESLLRRIEQIYKGTLIREGNNVEALNLIESILQEIPKNPYEIRDRGLILATLNCKKAAALDLDYFIEKCPNDPSVQLLEAHIKELTSEHQLVH